MQKTNIQYKYLDSSGLSKSSVKKRWRNSLVLTEHQPALKENGAGGKPYFWYPWPSGRAFAIKPYSPALDQSLFTDGQHSSPAGFWRLSFALLIDWISSKDKVPVNCYWVPTQETWKGIQPVCSCMEPSGLSSQILYAIMGMCMSKDWGIQPAICNVL